MLMRAARIHGYNQPLHIDEVPVPEVGPNEVLLKVAAAGMCRSDFQLVDGYFREGFRRICPSSPDTRSPGRSPPSEPRYPVRPQRARAECCPGRGTPPWRMTDDAMQHTCAA